MVSYCCSTDSSNVSSHSILLTLDLSWYSMSPVDFQTILRRFERVNAQLQLECEISKETYPSFPAVISMQ